MRTAGDLLRYAQLRAMFHTGRGNGVTRSIALRSLGGASVLCRASRDVWTLKHTFLEGYHLPPVPLSADATIVDLGSNVGYTVAHFAHLYPRARIIGVEMDRANFELAQQNTKHFGPRVMLIHAAVWNVDGEVAYEGDDVDAYQVSARTAGGSQMRRAPARRLTTILSECNVTWVDYMKIDIEGAEAVVLSDVKEWAPQVGIIKVEVHPPATLHGCRLLLEEGGFRCQADSRHWSSLTAVRCRQRS